MISLTSIANLTGEKHLKITEKAYGICKTTAWN
jgi:hypothetical protein